MRPHKVVGVEDTAVVVGGMAGGTWVGIAVALMAAVFMAAVFMVVTAVVIGGVAGASTSVQALEWVPGSAGATGLTTPTATLTATRMPFIKTVRPWLRNSNLRRRWRQPQRLPP